MITDERLEEFILKLESISRETGIAIGGCGCCGSPFLIEIEKKDMVEETGYCVDKHGQHITWLEVEDEYNKEHKFLIKRSVTNESK